MKPATLLCATLLLSACATQSDDSTCIGERKLATNKLATNKLATNKIATNKLATNGLLTDALPGGSLTSRGIADSVPSEALADDFVQSVLQYMVECALTPEQSIEVGQQVYAGALGLAPAWGDADGTCDAECRTWVSACLIARTNALGVSRPISLLGDRTELAPSDEEAEAFPIEEATYFGDLFGEDRAMYACTLDGSDAPERTCNGDPSCAITIVGDCAEACTDAGCRDAHGVLHAGAITVNLPAALSCG